VVSRPPTDRPAGDLQRENLQGVRGRQPRLRRLLGGHGGLREEARQQALAAPRRPARGEPAGGVDGRRRGDRVGGHVGEPAQRVVRRVPPLPPLLRQGRRLPRAGVRLLRRPRRRRHALPLPGQAATSTTGLQIENAITSLGCKMQLTLHICLLV
jgi:hypothetical protein